MAVLEGDGRPSRAPDRHLARHRAGADARRRQKIRLRHRHGGRVRHRQRRRLPVVRLAAVAARGRARLPPGLPDHPARSGARPHPVRSRRRALSRDPHGDGDRPVLVRLGDRARGLVRVRSHHPGRARAARRQRAGELSDRPLVWGGAGRPQPVRRLAPSGPRERRAGQRRRTGRRLVALALPGRRLAAAVHRVAYAVLRRRHPAAVADRDPVRRSGGQAPAAPGGRRSCRRRRPLADRGHRRAGPARRTADRRRLSDRVVSRPRCRRDDHERHHGDALPARRDQRRGDPAPGRLRLASRARLDRLSAGRGERRRRGGGGRDPPPRTPADAACRSCAICCSWCW